MFIFTRSGRTAAGLACTLCVLAGSAIGADAPNTARRSAIVWSNGLVDRVVSMSPEQVRRSVEQLASRPERRVLVTLEDPATAADRASLERSGLTLLSPLGGTSYFASLSPGADAGALSSGGIASVGPVDPSRKMHADVAGGIVRSWTLVGEAPEKLRRQFESGVITRDEMRRAEADLTVATLVMFHRDADTRAAAERLARAAGGRVQSVAEAVQTAVIHAPASAVRGLADDDAVMWVEPPLPALTETNASNRVLTGVDTVNAPPFGLDGSGVRVMVYDGGKVASHGDFAGRLTVGPTDTSFTSNHATHVAGTVGGSGAGNLSHRGMAPGVHIISYGLEQAGGLSQGFLYTDPCDLLADYTAAITQFGADISNNSIGTNTEPNGYPCHWQGDYGVTCALIDAIARGSTGSPFRIIWANGNERQGSRCDVEGHGDFYSTAPPAGAKNHIAVGSVDSDTDLTSSFSSWGPVDDGRIKPDVSAPGCEAGGDGGVTSASSSGGYTTMCGTSMAAPTVAGISALILEQWRLTFPDADDLRNSTLKAILANTAEDRGQPGPDYQYGYGSVRAVPAVETVMAENVIEAEVEQGETYRFVVIIGPEDDELRVTAAWDDAPGAPNVSAALVNDLDVRVIDPNGVTHYPWTLNPAAPGSPAVRSVRDGVNNIEQVLIDNPAPGGYTVEVVGHNIADGAAQTFGAASNGYLVNCSSAGLVAIGAPLLPCSGEVGVQVIDCDLNTSDSVIDTAVVRVTSDQDPVGFDVVLTETAAESAAFTGTVSFSSSGGAGLAVANGGQVTATYIDADDGTGSPAVVSSSVTVDCDPPVVSSAAATDIGPRAATIEVGVDEPASVEIRYGTSMSNLDGVASSAAPRTSHSIAISGLQDDTDYVFVVSRAEDPAGNASSNNNGGAGFAFTTPDIPEFFTEEFASGVDLNGKRVVFTPNGQFDFYAACVEDLGGALPVDPAGGQTLPMSDDDSERVSLSGGKQVSLYGASYGAVWVGSNGYLTFAGSDTDYTESLDDHFSEPRVSALFDDLNPSSAGTVRWQQLADRVAFTWVNVPEYSSTGSNTFQVEMFFDGRIAISHLSVTSGDAIIGLSEGNGLDPDYFASDLSSGLDCGACPADLAEPLGVLNFFDLSAYLGLYNAGDAGADLAEPFGVFNFFDISAYLASYNAGCP
jgi:subtilisin family serine protease